MPGTDPKTAGELPTGTLTFLFTDIQGSTALVQRLGTDRFGDVLAMHGRTLRDAFEAHGGIAVRSEGDAFFYVFRTPTEAVAAVVAGQRALAAAAWPHEAVVPVRMGLHTGEATLGGAESGVDYVGFDVHRAARIAAAGHGGQVLLSEAVRVLVHDRLPSDVRLRDLGEHRFKDLTRPEQIYQIEVADLPAEFPRIRSLDRTPNNLPTQLTSFIGRENEVREGSRLMKTARLLTLTGPGGTGKTRLSLQIAADVADEFPDGVYFVALASIVDPALVMSTVAHVLGLQTSGHATPLAIVSEHLRERRALLVLDNFEQILAAAPQVGELLRACPRAGALVSSRAALRVYGEQELPVPPLAMPAPGDTPSLESLSQFEAVRLFVARALAAKPDFAVTNENAPAVAGICARLDGLPLAIELAAARVRLLPPQAIFTRLEHRLTALGTGARDLPERQQTLRGAIAWSYDLLDEGARRLFRHFSALVGGGSLAEIESVCAACGPDALDGLGVLVDQSLVRQREVAGEPRFFMLETIREYGLERLAEDPDAAAVRKRHAEAYLAVAKRALPHLMGAERKQWLDALELDHDNVRAAIVWACETGVALMALRLGAAVWRFWQMRGHLDEARVTIARVLAVPGAAVHPQDLMDALEAAGGIAYWQGDMPRSSDHYIQALDLARGKGDPGAFANACYNLSFTMMFEVGRDPTWPLTLLDEALRIYRSLGDRAGIAKTVWGLANLRNSLGDVVGARPLFLESVEVFRSLGDRFGLGWALHGAGGVETKDGNLGAARAYLEEGLSIFADVGDVSGVTLLLNDIARLALATGEAPRALRLRGAADVLTARSGSRLASYSEEFEGGRHTGDITPDEAAKYYAEGQAMDRTRAVAYALRRNAD